MISDQQKHIYNLYLRALRVNNDKPFRPKKNFADVEKKPEVLLQLENIAKRFAQFPHLCNNAYFDAPYKVYSNDKTAYYGLDFYAKHKALTTCITYLKILEMASPKEQKTFIKESFTFIANFCVDKRITLDEYCNYKSVVQLDCFKHLKEHRLSWYVIFSIPNFYSKLHAMPSDEFALYYGEERDLNTVLIEYNKDADIAEYCHKCAKKIKDYIKNQLQKPTM